MHACKYTRVYFLGMRIGLKMKVTTGQIKQEIAIKSYMTKIKLISIFDLSLSFFHIMFGRNQRNFYAQFIKVSYLSC